MLVLDQDDGVHTQLTTVVTRLDLPNGHCIHTNSVRVLALLDQPTSDEPYVLSSHTEHTNNQLIRRTEVCYLKKKFIIEDVYEFDYCGGLQSDAEGQSSILASLGMLESDDQSLRKQNRNVKRTRKICFFPKKTEDGRSLVKRNTKNLPKNFYKGFSAFLESRNRTEHLDDYVRLVRMMGKEARYNNILIQKLLSNTKIAPLFRQFLKYHAEEWINASKINNKDVHLEAVNIYLSLAQKYEFAQDCPSLFGSSE